MAEGTRFKDLEKLILGLRQSHEQQEKRVEDQQRRVEDYQGALEELSTKMDLLLESVYGGRVGSRNRTGNRSNRNGEENSVVPFRSIKIDFPRFDGENPTGWVYKGKMLGDNGQWGCCRQYTQGLNISRPTGVVLDLEDDGITVFSGGCYNQAIMWPLSGGEPMSVAVHDAPIKEIAWIPEMNLLVTESWDKTLIREACVENIQAETST